MKLTLLTNILLDGKHVTTRENNIVVGRADNTDMLMLMLVHKKSILGGLKSSMLIDEATYNVLMEET